MTDNGIDKRLRKVERDQAVTDERWKVTDTWKAEMEGKLDSTQEEFRVCQLQSVSTPGSPWKQRASTGGICGAIYALIELARELLANAG